MNTLVRNLLLGSLLLSAGSMLCAADEPNVPPIKLHLDSAHPRDVFAELGKQVGVVFRLDPANLWDEHPDTPDGSPTSITVDFDGKSFWTVMAELCVQTNIEPTWSTTSGEDITLRHASKGATYSRDGSLFGSRPLSVTPAATFVAYSLRHNSSIDLDAETVEAHTDSALVLNGFVDPRLNMLQHDVRVTVETALDENGTSIAAAVDDSERSYSASACRWQIEGIEVPLNYDPSKSRKLAQLKGSVRVQVLIQMDKLEIDDLPKSAGADKTVAGIQFVVNDVREEKKKLIVKFTANRKDASKELWERATDNLESVLRFSTAAGENCTNVASGAGFRDEDQTSYTYTITAAKPEEKPVKLTWNIPTTVDDLELPFEFKDLPLP